MVHWLLRLMRRKETVIARDGELVQERALRARGVSGGAQAQNVQGRLCWRRCPECGLPLVPWPREAAGHHRGRRRRLRSTCVIVEGSAQHVMRAWTRGAATSATGRRANAVFCGGGSLLGRPVEAPAYRFWATALLDGFTLICM